MIEGCRGLCRNLSRARLSISFGPLQIDWFTVPIGRLCYSVRRVVAEPTAMVVWVRDSRCVSPLFRIRRIWRETFSLWVWLWTVVVMWLWLLLSGRVPKIRRRRCGVVVVKVLSILLANRATA